MSTIFSALTSFFGSSAPVPQEPHDFPEEFTFYIEKAKRCFNTVPATREAAQQGLSQIEAAFAIAEFNAHVDPLLNDPSESHPAHPHLYRPFRDAAKSKIRKTHDTFMQQLSISLLEQDPMLNQASTSYHYRTEVSIQKVQTLFKMQLKLASKHPELTLAFKTQLSTIKTKSELVDKLRTIFSDPGADEGKLNEVRAKALSKSYEAWRGLAYGYEP